MIFALANNHICLSLLIRLYFNSVQFMCIFAHEKYGFKKYHVHICTFTELSQNKLLAIINKVDIGFGSMKKINLDYMECVSDRLKNMVDVWIEHMTCFVRPNFLQLM